MWNSIRLLTLVFLTGCLFSTPDPDPFDGFRSYGGPGWESAVALRKTADQGHVVAVQIGDYTPNSMKASLLKLDARGDTQWTLIDPAGADTYVWDVIQVSDQGYLYTGCERTRGGDTTYLPYVKHVDAAGRPVWTRYYKEFRDGAATRIEPTREGGFLVALIDYGNKAVSWVQRIDRDGNTLWQKSFPAFTVWDFLETRDGGLLLVGHEPRGGLALKTDAKGDSVWAISLPGNRNRSIFDVLETEGRRFVAVEGNRDTLGLISFDSAGSVHWHRRYPGQYAGNPFRLQQTSDQGFLLAGSAIHSAVLNLEDARVLKTDAEGNLLDSLYYGWKNADQLFALEVGGPDRYLLAGRTEYFGERNFNTWIFEVDANGRLIR